MPGSLEFRDVAVRVVGTACRLLRPRAGDASRTSDHSAGRHDEGHDAVHRDFTHDEFATQVVSAFSEAFNNVAIHGYKGASPASGGRIDLEISADESEIVVRIRDWGEVYDPRGYEELPAELPERGMGLFIIRSFVDEIAYEPGSPGDGPEARGNVLTLKKRWPERTTGA